MSVENLVCPQDFLPLKSLLISVDECTLAVYPSYSARIRDPDGVCETRNRLSARLVLGVEFTPLFNYFSFDEHNCCGELRRGYLASSHSAKKIGLDPAAARALLRLRFSRADLNRADELAAKASAGTLAPAEERELEDYRTVGTALEFLKSKARLSLKHSAG